MTVTSPSNHENADLTSPLPLLPASRLDGGRVRPAPNRVQDNALNLTWYRGWGWKNYFLTPKYVINEKIEGCIGK